MRRYNIKTHPELGKMHCTSRPLLATKHASLRAIQKNILVPEFLTVDAGSVVECETENNKITKLVVRKRLKDSEWDIVLVVVPKTSTQAVLSWLLVTCWLNHKTDNHSTLNESRLSTF